MISPTRKNRPREEAVLLAMAIVVGLGAGVGAVVFRYLIAAVTRVSFEWLPSAISGLDLTYLILAPTLGGLAVGPMVHFFAREAKGHGVPEVMEAVALKGGRIRPVVAIVKSLASSICIGSGGSVGREGPIVQIGSALGSTVGQIFKLSDERIRILVASGAAGGIAATFNAPIAGVLFAMEIILGDISVHSFGTVVLASLAASVVGRAALGDVPAFTIPGYSINSLWEYPIYLLLGVLCAIVAVVYTRLIYWVEDTFDAWKGIPEWIKPAIGGAILGVIAIVYSQVPALAFDTFPQVYGVGYKTIEDGLLGKEMLWGMLTLMALKIIATALTLGSGGSGGVFAPGLFVGSMLGGSLGLLMNRYLPGRLGPPGAYALVGMGALFAGASHASMTSVVIMFEMTADYKIILPLMLSVVAATFLSRYLLKGESIYTLKLSRRGVHVRHGRDVDILQGVTVGEVMTRDVVTVSTDTPLAELTELFLQTNRHAFPVLDAHGFLAGIVSLHDLRNETGNSEAKYASDLMTRSVLTVFPQDTLDTVLQRMGPSDLSRLPVVTRDNPRKIVGVIRRSDLVRAYNLALTRRSRPVTDSHLRLRRAEEAEFVEIELRPGASCLDLNVEQMSRRLPSESLLISIRRTGGEVIFPRGDTLFRVGDRITAYVRSGLANEVLRHFT